MARPRADVEADLFAAARAGKCKRDAARAAGIGYRTLHRWLTDDEGFACAYGAAEDFARDRERERIKSARAASGTSGHATMTFAAA